MIHMRLRGDRVAAAAAALTLRPAQYYVLEVKEWHKPRTTGKGSQNNHLHGHARQVAGVTGNTLEGVIAGWVLIAWDEGIWPAETLSDGRQVPLDPKHSDTKACAELIEVAHRWAAEEQIPLIEDPAWGA